jgi:hypothetical protein
MFNPKLDIAITATTELRRNRYQAYRRRKTTGSKRVIGDLVPDLRSASWLPKKSVKAS